ncbi:MAG: LacI family DNA-binding transcriptional regulator [Lentisphaeria bacterium]|nr:LacI family DNA-binding transcriptional regulator [Lentisphaeria bacterium]
MTKLTDIAKKLNLDVSVISRALSQSPENQRRVSPKTRELIQETAKKMNYIPDRSAAFLRQKKAPTILCYLPGYTDRLVGNLVMGISEEATRQKFPVNFFFGNETADFEFFCDALKKIKHSGVITYPPLKMSEEAREELLNYHRNGGHILILNACSNGGIRDERFAGIPQLQINDVYGGTLAAKHFLSHGVEIFFREQMLANYESRNRGYEEELKKNGFYPEDFTLAAFESAVKSGKKTGIFAFTDAVAMNLMFLLGERGWKAGKDYFLIGHDNQFLTARMSVSLSTVHQPTREEGILAVQKVIRLTEGNTVEDELLNPWLVIRESSGGKRPDLEKPQLDEILY